ncbi:hypothetical protein ACPOL_0479 [Acidisarcina polymorpha]|uniref:DUF2062 domain-containing protein n=1 Tax=Acidisarcina polymorpha TaxID=2211140 RepID=A0A2Z5FTN3_9BACT|nr:hypothetical protein ACPOL_0479 [Acidisarcina polymorpha]
MLLPHRSIAGRLLHLLRQGLTAQKLALSIALGVGLSCFPIFGTTTILCTIVAVAFGLNLPAIQVGNYLALPLQLGLFIPFLRLGERVVHASRMPLSPQQLLQLAKTSPTQTAQILLSGQWHAILGWLIVAPPMTLLLAVLLRPLMRRLLARADRPPLAATITIQR